MNRTYLPNYNLDTTLLGGQSFGWDYRDRWYTGFTIDRAARIKRDGEYILWQTYPVKDDYSWLANYLRIDTDYENIMKKIAKDQYVENAVQRYPGLRLLNQEFEEAFIAFLCSSTKSIVGIRQCTRLLAQKFGAKVIVEGKEVSLFPRAEVLAEASIDQITECKVGFRATYIKSAAENLMKSQLVDNVKKYHANQSREVDIRNLLKQNRGVGDKIADCIMVYSLGYDNVTPLDVWGLRFAQQYYGFDTKAKYSDIRSWFSNYFEGYAGWAGQFLFEYIRDVNYKSVGK